ncbi:C40 family peptidase [Bradyrhizobium sp. USDA 4504]
MLDESHVAIEAAKAHARSEFPKESCGFIASDLYVACENKAKDPLTNFEIDDDRYDRACIAGTIQAVVHSHPRGPAAASEWDIAQQHAAGLPWIILARENGRSVSVVVMRTQ